MRTDLHECQLHQQSLVLRPPELHVCLVQDVKPTDDEEQICARRLFLKPRLHLLRCLDQIQCLWIATNHQVPQVASPAREEVMRVEPSIHDFVETKHGRRDVAVEGEIGQLEVRVMIKDVQLFRHGSVRQLLPRECHQLVKHAQRVPQGTIGLIRDDVQGFRFRFDPFLLRNVLQVSDCIRHRNPMEVEDLAPGKDGGENLVLLGGREDEHGMRRRLL